MLELQNIKKVFNPGTVDEKVALNDLSLKVEDGDFITIIGANGAGKSTMFNAIAGSFLTDSGRIILDGRDITMTAEHKRAKYIGIPMYFALLCSAVIVMSLPSRIILPESVRNEPAIALNIVDLPAPFAPIIVMKSPSSTLSERSLSATFSSTVPGLNTFFMFCSSSITQPPFPCGVKTVF